MDTDSGLRRSNGLRPPPPRTFQKATPAQEAEAEQGACGRAGAGVTSEAVRRAPGAGLERKIRPESCQSGPVSGCRGRARGFIGVVGALLSTLRGREPLARAGYVEKAETAMALFWSGCGTAGFFSTSKSKFYP